MARLSNPPRCLLDVRKISIEPATLSHGFGINLLSQFSSATGLGVMVRQIANALQVRRIPFAGCNIGSYYKTSNLSAALHDIAAHFVHSTAELPHPVDLSWIPVFEAATVFKQLPAQRLGSGRFHAALVWWEGTRMNPVCTQALNRLDAVVAFSDFVGEVLANSVQLKPVVRGSHPLELPAGVKGSRAEFGLRQDAVVFFGSLDPSSDAERKNPLATIQAFRAAFPSEDTGVRLLVRLNNAHAPPMAPLAVKSLFAASGGDGRIGFFLEPMNYQRVRNLYASADVFMSLHRSERLGLGMLQSMRLGVPVIATGWSGNMNFMDHRCVMLVHYRLVQVCAEQALNQPHMAGADAQSAEPVLEDAIAAMRLLRDAPARRTYLGALGRERAEQYQRRASVMSWVDDLRVLWENAAQFAGVWGKLSAEQNG